MEREIQDSLSYDDVLLVPKFSNITSRKHVDTSSQLTRGTKINVPIISANMDTVTESATAIAMARQGGIGIIHRFLPIKEHVEEVLAVKRSEAIIIEKPYTLSPEHTVKDAKILMGQKKITGIPVVDNAGRFAGILTRKDLMFEENIKLSILTITDFSNIA